MKILQRRTPLPALEECRLKKAAELPQDCSEERSTEGNPLYSITSYDNFDITQLGAVNEKQWTAGETPYGSRFYTNICRLVRRPNSLGDEITACQKKSIPRGSVISVVSQVEIGAGNIHYLARVMSIASKYNSLRKGILDNMVNPGDWIYVPTDQARPLTNRRLYIFRNENASGFVPSPLLLDFDAGTWSRYTCANDRVYVGFRLLSRKEMKYQVDAQGQPEKRYLDLDCTSKENILDGAKEVDASYNLVALVNQTFATQPYFVDDFAWTDEGLARFPLSLDPYGDEQQKNATFLKFKDVKEYLEGYGPEDRFVTYNYNLSEWGNRFDRWAEPRSMCSVFNLLMHWKNICDQEYPGNQYCTPQVGDMYFHSPIVVSKGARNPMGMSKDILGHLTHGTGRCTDFRVLSPTNFPKGGDGSRGANRMTNLFLELAWKIGASELYYRYRTDNTKAFVRPIGGHTDHLHICFPTIAERDAGVYKSNVSPYPVMKVNKTPELEDCYSKNL